jgi:tetratricopeptide (TPR) repeat protein
VRTRERWPARFYVLLIIGMIAGYLWVGIPSGSGLYAQSPGTTGAQFLKIKAGPRPTAMGGAYTALADGGYGMYWNPAGMSRRRRGAFVATHQEQLFDVYNELLGLTYPMSHDQTLGLSSRFRWDQQTRRSELETRNEFTNYGMSVGLNYAWGGRTGLAWGLGIKGIQSKLAGFTANSYAVDLGLHYQSPRTPLKLGLAVQNLGPELTFIREGDPLPRTFRFGWAYDFYPYRRRLTISNDLVYLQPEKTTSLRLGLEFKPYRFIALRGGYYTPQGFSQDPRLSAGLGVRYQDIHIDYAYESRDDFSNQHRFSLSVEFGGRPEQDDFLERPESLPSEQPATDREQEVEESLREQVPEESFTTGSVESLNIRADILFESGNYRGAIELWKRSLARDPIQRDVFRKMAIAYYELGEYQLAREYMKDASRGVGE